MRADQKKHIALIAVGGVAVALAAVLFYLVAAEVLHSETVDGAVRSLARLPGFAADLKHLKTKGYTRFRYMSTYRQAQLHLVGRTTDEHLGAFVKRYGLHLDGIYEGEELNRHSGGFICDMAGPSEAKPILIYKDGDLYYRGDIRECSIYIVFDAQTGLFYLDMLGERWIAEPLDEPGEQ